MRSNHASLVNADYARLPVRQLSNAAEYLRGPPLLRNGDLSPLQMVVKQASEYLGLERYRLEEHVTTDPRHVKAALYFHLVGDLPVYCGTTGRKASEGNRSFLNDARHQKFHAVFQASNLKYGFLCVDLWAAAEAYAAKHGGDPDEHYGELKEMLKDLQRVILRGVDFPMNCQLKAVYGARQVNFLLAETVTLSVGGVEQIGTGH